MKILDVDDKVASWNKKHGIKIPYIYNNTEKIYIPDFLIIYENKKVLEEIKGWEESEKKESKLSSLKKYCIDNGLESSILRFEDVELLSKKYFNKSIKQLREEFKICESFAQAGSASSEVTL
jgi:predicted nuclease of restriction endonuclease-like RecB superfamily